MSSQFPEMQPKEWFAQQLGCNPGHFRDVIAKRPKFPKPGRFGKEYKWRVDQVNEWLDKFFR